MNAIRKGDKMAPIVSRGFRGRHPADADPAHIPPGRPGPGLPGLGALAGWAAFARMFRNPR